MKKEKLHNWNCDDLTIAFYYAKWYCQGLGASEQDLVNAIGDTTKASLIKQAANFRAMLAGDGEAIDGFKLGTQTPCKKKVELYYEIKNKTYTQMKEIVLAILESREVEIKKSENRSNNQKAEDRKKELNAQYESNFIAKMKLMKQMGRNLRPIG